MILSFLIALIIALAIAWIAARILFRTSARKGLLRKRSDFAINGIIIAFVFFCSSSFAYIVLLQILR
ncbi:hypothetical protein [Fangia hongkongensis]|uniref:hypothetical protein n=1 Tax=Fangia hongkongensis TaxID=270495 RepID=UPI00037B35D6|nr:hypothetical protein [Fangia hongkongensis]MBK2125606.1 hypothetical protein [Fangia hongkongensis]